MAISDYSLRRPVTILVALAAVLVLGAVSITRLKLDFLPKVDWPFVGVQLPYPNAVPAQVEREIARPVEEVLATLGDVRSLRSYSDRDGAFVGVEFDFGRDIDVLRLEVKERLEQVRPLLPADLEDYFIFTFNTTDIPVMEGRISAPGRDLAGSYELLERRIIAPLQRIEGVGRVVVDGVSPKDVTIYLLLDRIVAHGVDVGRLFATLNASNLDLSLGRVQDGRQRVSVRSLGQFRSVEEIRQLPIGPGIRLADVAEVVYAEPAPNYYRHIDGEPAIAFEIRKASGANIVEVSRRVHAEIERFKRDPTLAGIDVMVWFDQGENIQGSLKDLLMSGLVGSLLAVGILLVFLRRLLTTLIAAIAIPVSVIATCAFLFLTHRSLNILTMMGLMLAVGMLVDNGIVVLEAIYRRHEKGEAQRAAAAAGTREVAMAVIASTATSVIVFAPIVLTKNTEITLWLSEVGVSL
ncbi:efflux RND transporter permease subunit [bacterium]|nr:efflux RND transporter permease subunit [bacterium]